MVESNSFPMFPLSVVVLPGGLLPLRIFEDRYRRMMADLLNGDGAMSFGIAPIVRGREVGGGEERATVATLVRAEDPRVLADGGYTLVAVGEAPLEVVEWLNDDPYPRARVRLAVDLAEDAPVELDGLLRRVQRLARRAGLEIPDDVTLPTAPGAALYALGALAPVSDFDRLRMLQTRAPSARAAILSSALDDVEAVLKFRES